jgi:hypothetical protein
MAQAIPIGLAIAGGALKAGGTIIGAKGEARQLRAQADQLDIKAGQERASAQRDAMEQQRQARLVSSRALAVAAASGAGADDPTVVNIMANIAGEGEYRALTSLYSGETDARALEAEATARRQEAKNTKKAAKFSAIGSIIGGASDAYGAATSMKAKYG